ncbi:MAG: ASKHA domain-containing protein [Nitriliruptoraceae bacterium]
MPATTDAAVEPRDVEHDGAVAVGSESAREPAVRAVFTPSGHTGVFPSGTTVLEAARELGVDLDSVCGGKGLCGRCQVRIVDGAFAKWQITSGPDNVSSPGSVEQQYRGRRPLPDEHRLGCATRIFGPVVIDVPPESQLHKQIVRKGLILQDLVLDPMITLHYLEVPPEPDDAQGDSALDRIRAELARAWQIDGIVPIFEALHLLHPALATASGAMTVAVRDRHLIAAWPGLVDRIAGIAIDIGSTTIAGHLVELSTGDILASAGRMNPQIRFGEDLMSRVSYAMMNPGGATALTAAVQFELDALVTELITETELDRSQVLDFVLVGNPIMHHLALGIDPSPLGQAPFTLATSDAIEVRASKLGINCPSAQVYVAPCIAGHVGADTMAAILAEGPHRSDAMQLLVDVGTNAEIVLGNRDGLYAASSPTGPAFEGAQLSCGQRATAGAIERVRIDPATLEPRFTVIGSDLWSDEDGFTDAVAHVGITGVCGSGVIELVAELYLAGVIDEHGVIRGELAERSARIVAQQRTFAYVVHAGPPAITLLQTDVRAIQLAKAALRAGIDLLCERAGVSAIDEIRLAGAFGAHIDPLHAMVLGLIPDAPLDQVQAVGNAAGAGAVRALVSRQQRTEMETVVGSITKIETALEPKFQQLFVDALAIPHRIAQMPHLRDHVELPAATASTMQSTRRRRSRKEAS